MEHVTKYFDTFFAGLGALLILLHVIFHVMGWLTPQVFTILLIFDAVVAFGFWVYKAVVLKHDNKR